MKSHFGSVFPYSFSLLRHTDDFEKKNIWPKTISYFVKLCILSNSDPYKHIHSPKQWTTSEVKICNNWLWKYSNNFRRTFCTPSLHSNRYLSAQSLLYSWIDSHKFVSMFKPSLSYFQHVYQQLLYKTRIKVVPNRCYTFKGLSSEKQMSRTNNAYHLKCVQNSP